MTPGQHSDRADLHARETAAEMSRPRGHRSCPMVHPNDGRSLRETLLAWVGRPIGAETDPEQPPATLRRRFGNEPGGIQSP